MRYFTSILIAALFCHSAFSQSLPRFKPLRYDEDYAFLKQDSLQEAYRRLKFAPLSKSRHSWLSTGGDIRFQYFYNKNEQWGDAPVDDNGYVMARFLLHTDLHIGSHFRAFAQLQSSLAGSRIDPSPVDDNPLDLHQFFFDWQSRLSSSATLTLRSGRQELLYGSQRLVAVREGPNNRQAFDAVRAILANNHYRLDLFYSHFVAAKPGIFDDGFNRDNRFWGAYFVKDKLPFIHHFDLYYLGVWKRDALFEDGEGTELRHSLGVRIWNNKGNWRYDWESLYQFGRLAEKAIRAWTASLNTSYVFSDWKFSPELGLKTEWISGDRRHGDDRLQTFNPLFPRGAYFGLAALIGPSNLIDIHPSLSLQFTRKLAFAMDYDVFWRHRIADGLYAVNGSLIYPGNGIAARHIGGQAAFNLSYEPNRFLNFTVEFTWFNAGSYLKAAGTGKDILFAGFTAQGRF